jgi:hypothetical protein
MGFPWFRIGELRFDIELAGRVCICAFMEVEAADSP